MAFTDIKYMPSDTLIGVPNSMTASLRVLTFGNEYQFTQRIRPSQPLDKRWFVSMTADLMTDDMHLKLDAFINEVQSTAGVFSAFLPWQSVPVGRASGVGGTTTPFTRFDDDTIFADGTGFVDGDIYGYIREADDRNSDAVVIENLVSNESQVLHTGDWFSILHGRRRIPTLYRVIKDAHSDSTGKARVHMMPELRYPVIPGDAVNFFNPRGTFRFLEQPEVNIQSPTIGTTAIQMYEVFEVLYERELT